jgi:(p)ppGpp synthase/HD superfamily hydrolase
VTRYDLRTHAREFALCAHGEQRYGAALQDGGEALLPYSVHLDNVAEIAYAFGLSVTVEAAAYLHDVLEDTRVTREQLVAEFGAEIAALVEAVTDKPGVNRAARHAATYPTLKLNAEAVALKLCDRIANAQAAFQNNPGLFKMYRKEHAAFGAALRTEGQWELIWEYLDNLIGELPCPTPTP